MGNRIEQGKPAVPTEAVAAAKSAAKQVSRVPLGKAVRSLTAKARVLNKHHKENHRQENFRKEDYRQENRSKKTGGEEVAVKTGREVRGPQGSRSADSRTAGHLNPPHSGREVASCRKRDQRRWKKRHFPQDRLQDLRPVQGRRRHGLHGSQSAAVSPSQSPPGRARGHDCPAQAGVSRVGRAEDPRETAAADARRACCRQSVRSTPCSIGTAWCTAELVISAPEERAKERNLRFGRSVRIDDDLEALHRGRVACERRFLQLVVGVAWSESLCAARANSRLQRQEKGQRPSRAPSVEKGRP